MMEAERMRQIGCTAETRKTVSGRYEKVSSVPS